MFLRISFWVLLFWGTVGIATAQSAPGAATDLYREGVEAFQGQKFSLAVTHFFRFVEMNPQDPRAGGAEYYGASALVSLGEFKRALDVLQKYPRKYPESSFGTRLAYWRGAAYVGLKDWKNGALEFENQARQKDELTFLARSLQGAAFCYEKGGQTQQAEGAYTRLLASTADAATVSQGLLRRGALRVGMGLLPGALEDLTKVLIEYPSSSSVGETQFWLAEAYLQQKDPTQAQRFYKNYLSLGGSRPLHDKVLLRMGEISKTQSPLESLPYYLTLVRDFPKSALLPTAWADLVEIYRDLKRDKDLTGAYEALAKLEKGAGELQKIHYNLAVAYLRISEPEAAAPWFSQASQGPDRDLAQESGLQQGLSLVQAGKKEDARRVLEAFAAENLDNSRGEVALKALSREYPLETHLAARLKVFERLVRYYGASTQADEYFFGLGDAHIHRKDWSEALSQLQKLIDLFPQSPLRAEAYYKIGFIFVQRSEFIRAEGYFFKVLDLAPPNSELYDLALYSRGISFYNASRYELAVSSFQRLMRENPKGPRFDLAQYYLALSQIQLGQTAEADFVLMRLASSASSPEEKERALWAWAENARRLSDPSLEIERWESYQKAFPKSPRLPESLYWTGLAQRARGQKDEALAVWEKLDAEGDKNWQYQGLYQRVLLLFEMGQDEKAWEVWKKILVLDSKNPANEELYFRSAEQLEAKENWVAAASAFGEFVKLFPLSPLKNQARVRGALSQVRGEQKELGLKNILKWVGESQKADADAAVFRLALDRLSSLLLPQEFQGFYDLIKTQTPRLEYLVELELTWVRVFQDSLPLEAEEKLQGLLALSLTKETQGEVFYLMASGSYRRGDFETAEILLKSLVNSEEASLRLKSLFLGARMLEAKGNLKASAEAYETIGKMNLALGDFRGEALWNAQRLYKTLGLDSLARDLKNRLLKEMPQSTWAKREE